jgi:hypothetical protein
VVVNEKQSVTLAAIVAVLDGKPAGDGWACNCPAHDDHSRHLSVTEKNGKILFHCNHGCDQGAVVAALKERSLWPSGNGQERTDPREETYIYRDAEGREAYRKNRFYKPGDPEKHFAFWHMEGGKLVKDKGTKESLLYRLPELLAALHRGETVYVTEGEKDVATLVSWGLVATCNDGGAKNWKAVHASYFPRGSKVLIVPDDDPVGIEFVRAVTRTLEARGCEIRVVILDKKDVTEWKEAGHTKEQFVELAEHAGTFSDWLSWVAPGTEEKEATPEKDPVRAALEEEFLKAPSHGLAADLLFNHFVGETIFERFSLRPGDGGEFYRRARGACYYDPFPKIREHSRAILEQAIDEALKRLEEKTEKKELVELFVSAGRAKQRTRTQDFLNGSLALLSDKVSVDPSVPWNATGEAIPTLDQVIDFSGDLPVARPARENEYFRYPAPCSAAAILEGGASPAFDAYLKTLFPDAETSAAALGCMGVCISSKATKTFQVWVNPDGDGGKNTLFDLLRQLLPERIVMAKNALITYRGDSSERRFGEIVMKGKSGVFFDEIGGDLDIHQIKRFTGLSEIRSEAKGRDSVGFQQTWALVAMSNVTPTFFPANDAAFLSRLIVLPFSSVFYVDEEDRLRRLHQGVPEERLQLAREKDQLIAGLLLERPQILHGLILAWLECRKRGGRPPNSKECAREKEAFRKASDRAEQYYDEFLIRDPAGRVAYAEIKKTWGEFFGGKDPNMREIVAGLKKRFHFVTTGKSHGDQYLLGVALKVNSCAPGFSDEGGREDDR